MIGAIVVLERYIDAAVQRRECQFFEDDNLFYCEIPDLPGVWAQGIDIDACVEELREVLVDWIQIGIEKGLTIPVLDDLELTAANVN